MQDSNTDRMTHNVFELVEYASHLMTLHPGDLISTGSPAGVGTARGDADLLQGRRHLDVHHRIDRNALQSREGGEITCL